MDRPTKGNTMLPLLLSASVLFSCGGDTEKDDSASPASSDSAAQSDVEPASEPSEEPSGEPSSEGAEECCGTGEDMTANGLSYVCAPMGFAIQPSYSIDANVASNNFSCAQGESGETVDLSCAGIGSGSIQCLAYASMGKTSGSCGSCETSLEDDGCVGYLPESLGSACVGQESCSISITETSASVAGESADFSWVEADGTPASQTDCGSNGEFKLLAYCGAGTEAEAECGE
jgi:hypothetical protein